MSAEEWSLRRLGSLEPNFVLPSYLPNVVLGRMPEVDKQCQQVSRQHLRLESYISSLDNRKYWKAVDLKSTYGTFVNRHQIPSNEAVYLNDRDVISLGGNFSESEVRGQNKLFLFSLHAPTDWSKANEHQARQVKTEPRETLEREVTPNPPSPPPSTSTPSNPQLQIKTEKVDDKDTHLPSCSNGEGIKRKRLSTESNEEKKDRRKRHKHRKRDLQSKCKKFKVVLKGLSIPPGASKAIVKEGNEFEWIRYDEEGLEGDEGNDDNQMEISNFSQDDEVIVIESESSFVKANVKTEVVAVCSDSDNDVVDDNGASDEEDVIFMYSTEAFTQLTESVIKQERQLDDEVQEEESSPAGQPQSSSEEEGELPSSEDEQREPVASTSTGYTGRADMANSTSKTPLSKAGSSKQALRSPEQQSISTPPKRSKLAPPKTTMLIAPMPHFPRSRKKKALSSSSPDPSASPDSDQSHVSLADKRKAKLKAIAEKDSKAKEPTIKKPSTAPRIAGGGTRSRTEKLGLHQQDQDSFQQAKVASNHDKSSSTIKPSPIRMEAEKRDDGSGNSVIKKLTFKNNISNTGSQNLYARPLNQNGPRLQYHGIQANAVEKRVDSKVCQTDSESSASKWNTSGVVKSSTKAIMDRSGWDINRDFLYRILEWNISWLSEQRIRKDEPPLLRGNMCVRHMRTIFSSFSHYCSVVYPLLLHETWASIWDHWERMEHHTPTICVALTQPPRWPPDSPVQLSILALLTQQQAANINTRESRVPFGELWIVRLDLVLGKKEMKRKFGLVRSSRLRELRHARLREEQQRCVNDLMGFCRETDRQERTHFFEATVEVILREDDLVKVRNKVVFTMSAIFRLKNLAKTFSVISEGPKTPFFPLLLKPSEEFFTVNDHSGEIQPDIADLAMIRSLNVDQRKVVRMLASRCTMSSLKQFVGLVKGPPGTGKTLVIAALILQMFSQWRNRASTPANKPRVLLVAPSNAAVDAAVRKLLTVTAELRRSGNSKLHLNILRVGNQPLVHNDVKSYTLDALSKTEIQKLEHNYLSQTSLQDELRVIQDQINGYGAELENASEDNAAYLNRKIKERTSELRRVQSEMITTIPEHMRRRFQHQVTSFVFNQADVIATTLASSRGTVMEQNLLKKGKRAFEVCIIDEASQATEPDSLLPLKFGFNKLIMVGDPEQLPPTVLSQRAKLYNFDVSLFARLLKVMDRPCSEGSNSSRVHMLRTQYRMHPDISSWPNRHFYGTKLINGHTTIESAPVVPKSNSTIMPYAVFDVLFSQETQVEKKFSNAPEAQFVATLLDQLLETLESRQHTVAVLTFYSHQVKELKREISNRPIRSRCKKVEVYTVDSFQGSEADIVFISCVRSGGRIGFTSEIERLNVALTRAKRVCYVVGHMESFKTNEMWNNLLENARRRQVLFSVPSIDTPVLPMILVSKR